MTKQYFRAKASFRNLPEGPISLSEHSYPLCIIRRYYCDNYNLCRSLLSEQ